MELRELHDDVRKKLDHWVTNEYLLNGNSREDDEFYDLINALTIQHGNGIPEGTLGKLVFEAYREAHQGRDPNEYVKAAIESFITTGGYIIDFLERTGR